MANPYVNKVEVNGQAILDLTGDTITPEALAQGVTAHNAAGAPIVGTMETGGGGEMYDAVIKCTNKNGFTSSSADYTWLAGSFDDLVTKFKAGEHITALAYCKTESYDDEEDYYSWTMQNLYLINAGMSGGDWGYDSFFLYFSDFGRGTKRYSLNISRNDDPDMQLTYNYRYN